MRRIASLPLLLVAAVGCGNSSGGPGAPIGSPCGSSGDCDGVCVPPSDLFPDGMCSVECPDGACPLGTVCLDIVSPSICYPICAGPGDCRDGYGCGSAGACVPCTVEPAACGGADADADADAEADGEIDGNADADADADVTDTTPLANGDPCIESSQCRSRLCLPASHGGVCAPRCAPDDPCDYGAACVPFATDTDGNGRTDGVAYGCRTWIPSDRQDGLACAADGECRSRICRDGMCTRLCVVAGDCIAFTTCGSYTLPTDEGPASFPACSFGTLAPGLAEAFLATESMSAGMAGRGGQLWVPPQGVSLTLVGRQQGTEPGYVGYIDVYDPASNHIYSYDDFVGGRDTPNWHFPDSRLASFFTPIAPRVSYRPGRYLWTPLFFGATSGSTLVDDVDFTAYVKIDPGGAVAGRLDANLFFIGCDAVNALSAPTTPRFQNALAEWQRIYGAVGITVGGTTYTDITGTPATRYRVVDYADDPDSGEVGPIMALSAGRTEHAVNVFFVHDFSGYGLLGIAGGIPGPPALHGTIHSGVIVCLDCAWSWGGDFIGQVIAHEVGHYLGLFHSTENPDGSWPYAGDPLPDTALNDTGNLMYWQARGGDTLSSNQGWVIRRSPTVLPP